MRSHTFADHLTSSQRGQRLGPRSHSAAEWLTHGAKPRAPAAAGDSRDTSPARVGSSSQSITNTRGIADLVTAVAGEPRHRDVGRSECVGSHRKVHGQQRAVDRGNAEWSRRASTFAAADGRVRRNTTTELFFRQAVGRLVRWRTELGDEQPSYMFIPDDIRLRTCDRDRAGARRHSLRKPKRDEADFLAADPWMHREEKVVEDFEQGVALRRHLGGRTRRRTARPSNSPGPRPAST